MLQKTTIDELARDVNTKALINTDIRAYKEHKRRQAEQAQLALLIRELGDLKREVISLKQEIQQIQKER